MSRYQQTYLVTKHYSQIIQHRRRTRVLQFVKGFCNNWSNWMFELMRSFQFLMHYLLATFPLSNMLTDWLIMYVYVAIRYIYNNHCQKQLECIWVIESLNALGIQFSNLIFKAPQGVALNGNLSLCWRSLSLFTFYSFRFRTASKRLFLFKTLGSFQ